MQRTSFAAVHSLEVADRGKSQSPEFTVGIDAKRTFVDKRSRPNLQRMTPERTSTRRIFDHSQRETNCDFGLPIFDKSLATSRAL